MSVEVLLNQSRACSSHSRSTSCHYAIIFLKFKFCSHGKYSSPILIILYLLISDQCRTSTKQMKSKVYHSSRQDSDVLYPQRSSHHLSKSVLYGFKPATPRHPQSVKTPNTSPWLDPKHLSPKPAPTNLPFCLPFHSFSIYNRIPPLKRGRRRASMALHHVQHDAFPQHHSRGTLHSPWESSTMLWR